MCWPSDYPGIDRVPTAASPFQASRGFYSLKAMNTLLEAGEPVEPFRVVIGFNNQELSATWPFIQ
jgi:hypothetical protein